MKVVGAKGEANCGGEGCSRIECEAKAAGAVQRKGHSRAEGAPRSEARKMERHVAPIDLVIAVCVDEEHLLKELFV